MGSPLLIALATALAAPPGGLRLDSGLPEVEAHLRDAWAIRGEGPHGAHQLLADLQLPLPGGLPVVLEAELPVVHHWNRGAADLGLGQVRLAGRLWGEGRQGTRRVVTNSWGLELALPTRLSAPEGSWVLHSAESLPAMEALYVVELSIRLPDDGWVHLRGGAGLIARQDTSRLRLWPPAPMLDLGAAWIAPLGTSPLSVGTELELITDRVPLATRHWLRTDYGRGLSFDAGVQIPWIAMFTGSPELAVIGQLTWRSRVE